MVKFGAIVVKGCFDQLLVIYDAFSTGDSFVIHKLLEKYFQQVTSVGGNSGWPPSCCCG